jgi:hypothetical protein
MENKTNLFVFYPETHLIFFRSVLPREKVL